MFSFDLTSKREKQSEVLGVSQIAETTSNHAASERTLRRVLDEFYYVNTSTSISFITEKLWLV